MGDGGSMVGAAPASTGGGVTSYMADTMFERAQPGAMATARICLLVVRTMGAV